MPIKKVDSNIDFVSMEHKILDFWEKNQVFNKRVEMNQGKSKWSFLDGPITANNPMGVHHAWGRTLKDLYQRYKAMTGHELRYQNGFDGQGLWIEVEVEKELGFSSKTDIEDYGVDKFVTLCKKIVCYKKGPFVTNSSHRRHPAMNRRWHLMITANTPPGSRMEPQHGTWSRQWNFFLRAMIPAYLKGRGSERALVSR